MSYPMELGHVTARAGIKPLSNCEVTHLTTEPQLPESTDALCVRADSFNRPEFESFGVFKTEKIPFDTAEVV